MRVVPGDPSVELRLPNLIVAGVSKGGTTSLFNYLGQHPDVCSSDVKELRYFTPLRHGAGTGPVEDYARHFKHCGSTRYAVESTPGYFNGGQAVARGIENVCPQAHVLVSLRSPSERCWSWFRFVKSRLRIPKEMSFEAYLDRCEELHHAGLDGEVEHQAFWGLGGGCYATWFDAWVEQFDQRFRVVFFEDVVANPAGTVKGICRWLGIDDGVVDSFDFPVENKTEQYRGKALQKAAVHVNRRSERFFRKHATLKRVLRGSYYALNRQPPDTATMSAAASARLADFYALSNARLLGQLTAFGVAPPAWLEPPTPPSLPTSPDATEAHPR